MRRWRVVLRGMFLIVVLAVPTGTAHAASGFANVAFAQQWQRGEALAPNFWGPLGAARDGQSEAYGEADGGMRLVQYFDKGRMELGHGSTVTNGLLATELVTGRMQTGDTRFADRPSPAIPIAGDSEGGGLTYALLSTKGQELLAPAPRQLGGYRLSAVSPTGEIAARSGDPPPYARYALCEITTKHEVSQAFAAYRHTVGEETIGLAISQPFFTTVQVARQERDVLVQVFERRVLTYTNGNPDGFKVEMGNVGQHYYRWRYGAPAPLVQANTTNSTAVCTDPGDGAVDQNGVSVDVWAPGVRRACGFMGYENGDNPMPPGTPFDNIRPFRFDSNYDHNEAVYGFKVFYYHGNPTTHCGDVREVLHQGGGTRGFAEEYHTYQVAIAQCSNNADRATMHILDVGGQADLGCLVTRTEFNATGETCQRTHTPGSQGERITADTRTCRTAIAGADCITTWYPTISFSGPNGVSGGVETTLIVNDPISLVDPTDITRVVKTNDYAAGANGQYNGVKRGMSLLLVYGVSSSTSQRWSSVWDATSHKQVPVPAGTAGSWPMRVDAGFHADAAGVTMQYDDEHPSGFGDHTGTEGASTQRHGASVSTGIIYPN